MTGPWIISMVLLWVAVIVLVVLVLLLYRQFGLTYLSSRTRHYLQGLDLGARARPVAITGFDGTEYEIDWQRVSETADATVLVFAQPDCAICGDLAREVVELPRTWPFVKFIWIDGTSVGRSARAVDNARGWVVGGAQDDAVHRAWDVVGSPFSYVVGRSARVVAKGVVNAAADIEGLLTSALGTQAVRGRVGEAVNRKVSTN